MTQATATYPKHVAALASALKDVGVHEDPPGSNTGSRVRTYQSSTWLGGTGWPWCVAFCVYHATGSGLLLPYRGAGAYAWLDWAQHAGWAVPKGLAIPGDFVVFSLGSGHMGMLRQPVRPGDTTVATVDGNTSDMVALRERPLSQVRGFVHVPEKPTGREQAQPPPKAPMFEVVGSESGHRVIYVSGARAIGRKIERILGHHPAGVTIRPKPRQK